MNHITASCVGSFGRWGNSMCQAFAALTYAHEVKCEVHLPQTWKGWNVFTLPGWVKPMEQPCSERANESQIGSGKHGIDLHGYFQDERSVNRMSQSKLKEWFVPKQRPCGKPVVAHLRRGDYFTTPGYPVIPLDDYMRAMTQYGCLSKDVFWVSDCMASSNSTGDEIEDWLTILCATDMIFRANSSYSWTAAVLSEARVFSPDISNGTPVRFVDGNDCPLCSLFGSMRMKP